MSGFDSVDIAANGDSGETMSPLSQYVLDGRAERTVEKAVEKTSHVADVGLGRTVPISPALAQTSCDAFARPHRTHGQSIPWDLGNGGCFGNGSPVYDTRPPVYDTVPIVPVNGNQEYTIILSEGGNTGLNTYPIGGYRGNRYPVHHGGESNTMVIHSNGQVPNIEQQSKRVVIEGIGEMSSDSTIIGQTSDGRPIYAQRGANGDWTADHSLMVGGMILEGLRISKGIDNRGYRHGDHRGHRGNRGPFVNDPRNARRFRNNGYRDQYGGFTSNKQKNLVLSGVGIPPNVDQRSKDVYLEGIGGISESSTKIGHGDQRVIYPNTTHGQQRRGTTFNADQTLMLFRMGLEGFRILKD